ADRLADTPEAVDALFDALAAGIEEAADETDGEADDGPAVGTAQHAQVRLGADWLDLHLSPLRDERGEVEALLLVVAIVTERITVAERFTASVKSLTDRLSGEVEQVRARAGALTESTRSSTTRVEEVGAATGSAAAEAEQAAANADTLEAAIAAARSQSREAAAASSEADERVRHARETVASLVTHAAEIEEISG